MEYFVIRVSENGISSYGLMAIMDRNNGQCYGQIITIEDGSEPGVRHWEIIRVPIDVDNIDQCIVEEITPNVYLEAHKRACREMPTTTTVEEFVNFHQRLEEGVIVWNATY